MFREEAAEEWSMLPSVVLLHRLSRLEHVVMFYSVTEKDKISVSIGEG